MTFQQVSFAIAIQSVADHLQTTREAHSAAPPCQLATLETVQQILESLLQELWQQQTQSEGDINESKGI